ncbi:MAG: VRR-NUC domain-containing protein [Bacteroidales bacterium]|nr:VRR-NUC domain-containing protein [Bacteroidales bacterium]
MAAEKQFENKVKKFLKDRGCYQIKYWGGGTFTKSGVPDILCCCNGVFLGIELKGPTGKPSEIQLHHLRKIEDAGGFAVLLYPKHFELFKNMVDCFVAEDYENAIHNYELLKGVWESGKFV